MSVPMSVIVSFRCLNCFLLCWFSVCLSRCVNKLLACDCHPDEWYSVWESYSLYSALLLVLVPLLVLHYMSIWGAIWTGLLLVKRSSQFGILIMVGTVLLVLLESVLIFPVGYTLVKQNHTLICPVQCTIVWQAALYGSGQSYALQGGRIWFEIRPRGRDSCEYRVYD